MSQIIQVRTGSFGRAALLDLDAALVEHAHSHGHLLFSLDGKGVRMNVGGEPVRFDKNHAVAINSWQPHAVVDSMMDRRILYLVFYLDLAWMTKQCIRLGTPARFTSPSIAINDSIHNLVQSIFSMLLTSDETADLEQTIVSLFEETIINSSSTQSCSATAVATEMNNVSSDFRIRRSIEYMRAHLDERSNFEAVARSAGLSRPHFFALFRKHMKMTPSVFWNTLRIENSIKQLTTTNILLSDLAYDMGFTEPGNFSRFFKNHVGVAPSEYRLAGS